MRTTFSFLSSSAALTRVGELVFRVLRGRSPRTGCCESIDDDRLVLRVRLLRRRCSPSAASTGTPFCSIGAISIMMMSSTSMTSTSGVTLMSDFEAAFGAANIHCHRTCLLIHRKSGIARASAGRTARATSDSHLDCRLLRRLLDEVVDQLGRRVVHLDVEVLDAAGQVVVEPHRRDRDDEAERRLDERFRDTGRDRAETARAGGRDALERGDDADDRAEQSDERRRRADGRERRDALLQVVGGQRRGALNGAADGVDQVFTAAGWRRFPAGTDIPAVRRGRPWRGGCSGSSSRRRSRWRPSAGLP